jgi:hypothetical protein
MNSTIPLLGGVARSGGGGVFKYFMIILRKILKKRIKDEILTSQNTFLRMTEWVDEIATLYNPRTVSLPATMVLGKVLYIVTWYHQCGLSIYPKLPISTYSKMLDQVIPIGVIGKLKVLILLYIFSKDR